MLGAAPAARVLDADALNLLPRAAHADLSGAALTPHPGEAGRMLGQDAATVQADRFAALAALVERYGATVVLKGAGTLAAAPAGVTRLLPGARPAMAAGGMGDVLTGIVGALLAQGLAPALAADCGLWLHATAAERAAAATGAPGLLPGDLMAPLARARGGRDG
ncbi:MAG: ADP/ATP-dependent (S)-NAD(P)H-hydrate dehydratase [Halofilum sp. (in: g-proteobacteria)]|nr:ADP/ATP-dependent (S)-NAD(P)H-hydrate dehydratase [Halofilum sp. (in: g-proteobacteria)]